MFWHQIVIPASEFSDAAEKSLIHGFVGECIEAGIPEGAAIYKGQTAEGDCVYYFSPVASSIATDLLDAFDAMACSEPDLTGLVRVMV